eukprot:362160-Chlamydomonas_euryale.AAC.2
MCPEADAELAGARTSVRGCTGAPERPCQGAQGRSDGCWVRACAVMAAGRSAEGQQRVHGHVRDPQEDAHGRHAAGEAAHRVAAG